MSTSARPPRRFSALINQALGVVGRVLISVGLLLLGFVGYQLWGTGIEQSQAQDRLESTFDELLSPVSTVSPTATSTPAPTTVAPTSSTVPSTTAPNSPGTTVAPAVTIPYELGEPVARLSIPRLEVDQIVVAGVGTSELKMGPGHFPGTPLPGRSGNAALAGHRTSYGAPFGDLDRLEPGDEILLTTLEGEFRYAVEDSFIVAPTDTYVVDTLEPNRATLTLVTCHPKYSTRERLIISAGLLGDPIPTTVTSTTIPTTKVSGPSDGSDTSDPDGTTTSVESTLPDPNGVFDPVTAEVPAWDAGADPFASGWFAQTDAWWHVAGWGTVLTAIAVGAFWLGRRRLNERLAAVVAIVPFLIGLYFFYQNLNRLLPAGL